MRAQDDSRRDGQVQTDGDFSRRRFLKGTAAAGVAAAGVSTAASGVTAQFGGPEIISLSDSGWFGWSADGSLPVADELLVFIHGWFGDSTVSSQANDVISSVESGGYSPDATAAIEWPATTLNYFGAESDTEDVGETTAGLVEDFYDAGGGNLRLVGHSLGGRSVYWTATKLASGYEIETVAGLGAAADGSEICGSPWNSGVSNACEVRNYHSGNDSTVGGAYGGFGDTALGTDGAGCSVASNYTDVDVTWSVGGHLEYLGNAAVGDDLATAINSGSCGDSGGGGSDGGSSDGGSDDGGSDDGGSDDGGSDDGWSSSGGDDGGYGWF